MHLILDGYGGNRERLESVDFIYQILHDYPAEIGMVKVSSPQVSRYVGSKPEDWGVSGFVIIAESHISIHTFPERRYLNVDVFSCKEFDAEKAIKDLQRQFELTEVRTYVLNRGLEYYNSQEALKVETAAD